VIYLDKNHHPKDGIKAVVEAIDQKMPKRVLYTKVFLLPRIEKPQMEGYHFSFEYMAQVFANACQRDDHETLDNTDLPKVFGVVLMFLGFNLRVAFDNEFLKLQRLDTLMELPLTNESMQLHADFPKLFAPTLEAAKSARGLIEPDNAQLLALIKHVEANSEAYQVHAADDVRDQAIVSELNRILGDQQLWVGAG